MKKIMLGILMLFLVAFAATNVNAVTGSLSWNTVGTVLPTSVAMIEDTVDTSITDLVQYITQNDGGDATLIFTSSGSTHIAVAIGGTTPYPVTLTPAANWHGTETITFKVSDSDDLNVESASVTITVANDNTDLPTVTGTNPASPITIDEDVSKTITLLGTTPVGTITYSIVTQPSHGSLSTIDQVLDQVVYSPTANYYGTDSFVFKATNEDGDSLLDRTVNININLLLDDTPVLPTISDYVVQEDLLIKDIVLPAATDADGVSDTITYDLEIVSVPSESTFAFGYYDPLATTKIITGWSGWNPTTRTISGWIPDKADVGELKLKLIAKDSQDTLTIPSRAVKQFTINVFPKTMCELGEQGIALDMVIDNPDDGDDFGPGDTIKIEVTVDNSAAEDKDIIVKAILYDIESHKKIDEVESDEENIEEDEDYKFEMNLQVSLDSDEDYKGDYVLFIKAYEEGEEDYQCISDAVEIGIKRISHEVIVQDLTIETPEVKPGDVVDVTVGILNIGKKDEDVVKVTLKNADLGIDVSSDTVDLAKYDEAGNSYVFRFNDVKISRSAVADTHYLEVFVVFNNGATSKTYMDSPTYKIENSKIVVTGAAGILPTEEVDITVSDVPSSIEPGKSYSMPVKVTNYKNVQDTFSVKLINIADWATSVSEKTITLEPGKSETVYMYFKANEEIVEGKFTATVEVKDGAGNIAGTETVTIGAEDETKWYKGSSLFWIIAYIVIIVVVIFFIKLVVSKGKRRKKGKVKEVRL